MRPADVVKREILALQDQLNKKTQKYFVDRLKRLLGKGETTLSEFGVSNLYIDNQSKDEWKISYNYMTKAYDSDAYNNLDTDQERRDPVTLTDFQTTVSFGMTANNRMYLTNCKSDDSRFKIYYKSLTELRIINREYLMELDKNEQHELMETYAKNANIPEWLAISFYLIMSKNKWRASDIMTFLSVL